MNKRVVLVKLIGTAVMFAAVMCAIFGFIGPIGAMEFGANILKCSIRAMLGLAVTVGLGKIAFALMEV